MPFVYKHFHIYMNDDRFKYINTKTAEEHELTYSELKIILSKAGALQICFNGYELEVLRYVSNFVFPIYFYNKGIYYYTDYLKIGENKNILKTYYSPTFY